jgi:hypothetical protein
MDGDSKYLNRYYGFNIIILRYKILKINKIKNEYF